jgi:hypothetical protein
VKGGEELLDSGISAVGHLRGWIERLWCKAQMSSNDEVLSAADGTNVGVLLIGRVGGGGRNGRRGGGWCIATDFFFFLAVIAWRRVWDCRKEWGRGRRRRRRGWTGGGWWERRSIWFRSEGGWTYFWRTEWVQERRETML